MLNIIAWIILGLIAGAIAKAIYPGRQGGGIVSTMFLGIIGAVIGGVLVTLFETGRFQLTAATLSIPGVIVAIIGAMIAIFIWNLVANRASS
ncbi:GlsB/YeaQ/YmgE family stress response membrane protein [Nostoc sp. UHCC 0251]|uniref:GlsB/YeaQ/YmgE family stress response membrane protein n=1 Tax=Nostoc sp. UHCC 0251 TaxID=3110240 RepID=UPI002B218676|nr:GlsB/YeaQ/YmgE family stress response membrane protein [Nostoc sp. UHCC 0251]MEA5627926.1 GlsB/YeaQ/YmgE family stress response membrane protein [Nostoc sp. UHCC 0251]